MQKRHVRYTSTEERRMLDVLLRLAVLFVLGMAAMTVRNVWKRRKAK